MTVAIALFTSGQRHHRRNLRRDSRRRDDEAHRRGVGDPGLRLHVVGGAVVLTTSLVITLWSWRCRIAGRGVQIAE
jgi:hypothetical protein